VTVLALDLGTTTGWAMQDPVNSDVVFSGSESFKPSRFDSVSIRYVKMREWLSSLPTSIEIVYFEEVRRHIGTDAAHAYGGYLATLQTWCTDNSVEYRGVPVATIKKFWTGKGNAKKDDMVAECKARGFDVKDDNQADAIALLHLAMEKGV
jgi:Holliday junction resolvasome RuvABC endonuclease subunit